MPTYLFYPRRADGVSLTFIAEAAENDAGALALAAEVAEGHDCVGVFVWRPAGGDEEIDRFIGEVDLRDTTRPNGPMPRSGAAAPV